MFGKPSSNRSHLMVPSEVFGFLEQMRLARSVIAVQWKRMAFMSPPSRFVMGEKGEASSSAADEMSAAGEKRGPEDRGAEGSVRALDALAFFVAEDALEEL